MMQVEPKKFLSQIPKMLACCVTDGCMHHNEGQLFGGITGSSCSALDATEKLKIAFVLQFVSTSENESTTARVTVLFSVEDTETVVHVMDVCCQIDLFRKQVQPMIPNTLAERVLAIVLHEA